MLKNLIKKYYKDCIVITLLAILIFTIFYYQVNRYDFIPERDTYHWLSISEFIDKYEGEYPSQPPQNFPVHKDWTYYRSFSFVLLNTILGNISGISIYRFYEFISAFLFFGLLLLASYMFIKKLVKNKLLACFSIILIATSGTLLEQFAQARPFISLFVFLIIVLELSRRYTIDKKEKNILFAVIVSFLSIFYHPANLLLLLIPLLTWVIFKINKKNRVYFLIALLVLLAIGFVIMTDIYNFSLTKYFPGFKNILFVNPYEFKVSTYYGFDYYLTRFVDINILFFILGLILVIYGIAKQKRKDFIPLLIALFIAYLLVDLIYKLGISSEEVYFYRGLSIFSLVMLIFVILAMFYFKKIFSKKIMITCLAVIIIFNIAYLEFRSLELIFSDEVDELSQIKNLTEKNSIFITQYESWPLVINYLNRTYFTLNSQTAQNIFMAKNSKTAYKTILNILTSPTKFNTEFPYATYGQNQDRIKISDFYLLYSKKSKADKYIREKIFPNANLEKFNNQEYFEKIFEGEEIILWKIKL